MLVQPRGLAAWFVLCTLPTGLGCALLTPIDMFSDEMSHIARADGLLYGEIFGVPGAASPPGTAYRTGAMVNIGIFNVLRTKEFDAFPDKPVTEAARRETEAVRWDDRLVFFPTQMVEYFPIFYVPAALGLLAGEISGLSPLHSVYLARLAMLLTYIALGAAALALARKGAALFLAVLTLPAAINLGSSSNQDGVMIASCVFAASMLTRPRPSPGPGLAWLAALAALTAVVCAKTPYAALFLFCLPPLLAPGFRRRAGLVLLSVIPPGLWLLHTVHNGFIPYPLAPYHPGPLWPGPRDIWLHTPSARDNWHVLLAHPAAIITLPLISLRAFWSVTWPFILGGIAAGNVLLPTWELPFLIISLSAAAAGSMVAGTIQGWRAADAGLVALALFGAFIGMELAMYLTYTSVGMPYIAGVSPRYFLLLMPFFVFLLPWAGWIVSRLPGLARLTALEQGWFALPAMAMAAVNIYVLPVYIFHLFRMPWP
jgi:hypothetical protein